MTSGEKRKLTAAMVVGLSGVGLYVIGLVVVLYASSVIAQSDFAAFASTVRPFVVADTPIFAVGTLLILVGMAIDIVKRRRR